MAVHEYYRAVREFLNSYADGTDAIIIIDGSEVPASGSRGWKEIPEVQIISPKRLDLFPKNDSIYWTDHQQNLRGRQHQRLIFQRTTHK